MLHRRLQVLRLKKGLSQKEMAEKMHKSPSAYNRMEKGKVKIMVEDLPEIAGALNCTVIYLLEELSIINIQQEPCKAHAYDGMYPGRSEESGTLLKMLLSHIFIFHERSELRFQKFVTDTLSKLRNAGDCSQA